MGVESFWRWWAMTGQEQASALLDSGDMTSLTRLLEPAVDDIAAGLSWEIGPGMRARHALVVSSGGIGERRSATERWYRAAPSTTPLWEYHPARPAAPNVEKLTVQLAGHHLSLGDVRVLYEVDHEEGRLHVGLHHPALPVLPERARRELALIALDRQLGEDDVERWVGGLEILVDPPTGTEPLAALALALDTLRATAPAPAMVEYAGTGPDGAKATLSIRWPRRRLDHPLLDEHHVVTLAYDAASDGLPTADGVASLSALEADLAANAHGSLLIAVESGGGHRAWHWFGDSEDDGLRARLAAWAERHRGTYAAEPDPAWKTFAQHP